MHWRTQVVTVQQIGKLPITGPRMLFEDTLRFGFGGI